MVYSNNSGTSESSFKIGPQGIVLSSSAVINDPTKVLNGYKRVTATSNGKTGALVYDIEIPERFIIDCSLSNEDPHIYILTIMNRYTGRTETVNINTGVGNSGVTFAGGNVKANNIASFADDTGHSIKDSGFAVYDGAMADGSEELTAEVPTVSSVYSYVGQLTDYLRNRLNGERLEGNS